MEPNEQGEGQKPEKPLTPYEAELRAMAEVANALDALDTETRGRIVSWAAQRYRLGGYGRY